MKFKPMDKYNSYSCSNMLNYLDSWYESDTEQTNYAKYLLTMLESETIKDMIHIYDKVLWKFLLLYEGLGKEADCDGAIRNKHLKLRGSTRSARKAI